MKISIIIILCFNINFNTPN